MTTRAPNTSRTPTIIERYTLLAGDRLMLPKGTVHTAYAEAEGCLSAMIGPP